jgi:nicotinamide mononucleotide transporter
VRKILENWLYWIVVDVLAVFLFMAREAVLVALVMVVYSLIAIFGFRQWKRKMTR